MRFIYYRRILIVLVLAASLYGTYLGIEYWKVEGVEEKVSTVSVGREKVIPGGMTIGIYMETDGVLVLNTDSIEGLDGAKQEPAKNLVKAGDYIVAINGDEVENKAELIKNVENLESEEVILTLRRADECLDVKFDCVQTETDEYRLGIWVRDSIQGLGTITYLTGDNHFGALGHGIHDADTEGLLEIADGAVYKANVVGIEKGEKGNPGGLEGVIIYNRKNILGRIEKNLESGIYGIISNVGEVFEKQEAIEVCKKHEIKTGDAVIRCAIGGEVREYDVKIKSVDYFARDENKGIVLEVVDEELLKMTGGIVQGMSGSPVIQNGRIVGAVTHVLVNDPTRGYGIFIENMLEH